MEGNQIVLYGIGGLGADERVFEYLDLVSEITPITWIKAREEESLQGYAQRISNQIDTTYRFGLIGVSFGGILAIEMNKIVSPEFTILISSASKSSELPTIRNLIYKMGLLRIIPDILLKPPFLIMKYLFGAQNSKLLKEILNDTDIEFVRWSMNKILAWDFDGEVKNLYQIHGSKDILIPLKNASSIVVKGGGHFMVVDRAIQVSEMVNSFLFTMK